MIPSAFTVLTWSCSMSNSTTSAFITAVMTADVVEFDIELDKVSTVNADGIIVV